MRAGARTCHAWERQIPAIRAWTTGKDGHPVAVPLPLTCRFFAGVAPALAPGIAAPESDISIESLPGSVESLDPEPRKRVSYTHSCPGGGLLFTGEALACDH